MRERHDCQAAESPGGRACSIPQIGSRALVFLRQPHRGHSHPRPCRMVLRRIW